MGTGSGPYAIHTVENGSGPVPVPFIDGRTTPG